MQIDGNPARIEAIERSLFDRASVQGTSAATTCNFDQSTNGICQWFEVQQRSLEERIAEQVAAAIASLEAGVRLPSDFDHTSAPTHPNRSLSSPAVEGESTWPAVIFSTELLEDPQATPHLQSLCGRILAREPEPSVLAGQLLVFQNSNADRRPQLLKEIGEAFYRSFPKSTDAEIPLEEIISRWLERMCKQAGFQNSIELVRPGQRFDSTRHLAEGQGGVEITHVHGWVVLRNRDKVYTKASVTAR